ncbi:glycosyltransferase [Sphingomonas aliaeris]|uniref:Glycosyltransferase n=1 Tax=Sphingomonas aliaeris TaxID=2759526 RepID=A0A974S3S4_9SPHN|nr:glycosyltransferase [Sphingomonas aliaeris]QQV76858.1 glycosyltransferase [Sphingomonas aliaeris]
MDKPFPAGPRHILTYAETWRGGGVERVQLRLARGWIAAGWRVTLVLGDPEGPLASEAPDGLEILPLGSGGMLPLMRLLPDIVAERRPDVIFCPGNHYTGAAAWLRLRLGRTCPPIVAKVSNALGRPDQRFAVAWAYRRWLALHHRFVSRLVAMTPAMADEAADAMRIPRGAIAIIPNPPVLPIPGATPPVLPGGRFILGVGRLAPQKRWDRLIAAVPKLADRDLSVVILGEGDARAALTAQIAALGLGHRVHLPGHSADPLPTIARAVAVVLVSDFEGVPSVLREALSLGTPVVTTGSSVAVREIVTGPDLGTVLAAGDEAGLIAAIDHWGAPGQPRPAPVPQPGEGAADEYLRLFESVIG